MKNLVSEFLNPSAKFRGKPFWSWNGKLEKPEVLRQAKILKEMGFGGYFMHSRVGLETEYLGKEWFEVVNAGADESVKLGMEAWLYDEDRWPSGSAGGLATKDPALRMQGVRMIFPSPSELTWGDDLLGAFAMKLNGFEASGVRRLAPGKTPHLRSGETLVAFRRETMPSMSFYNGHGYLDTTNPVATAEFLRVTHERYAKETGGRLGKSIKGIFIDEPHRGMISSIAAPFSEPEWVMPWGAQFAETFSKRFCYDIVERLPEVFLQVDGARISQVKWHYVEHLQQLFLENFMRPIFEWCDRHRLALTGHLLHEDSLTSETIFNGSMMRNYEFLHAPGVDMLWEGNRSYWAVKKVTSVARQFGRGPVLSELYGCTGWQFDFKAHKAVGDWQSLFGVSLRCPHLSWYTMKGESKRDYPASILHQSAWYPYYRYVEDYFSRIHVLMSDGQALPGLLVVNPVETVWSQIHQGWARWLYPRSQELQQVEENYARVFHWLAGNQIDFDYGDEDHILRLGKVVRGSKPSFQIGKSRYSAVLVAGMETIRSSTLEKLESFAMAGGKVIFCGPTPAFVDALPSTVAGFLAQNARTCEFRESALVEACRQMIGEPVAQFTTEPGARAANGIFSQVRINGPVKTVVAINTDWENSQPDIRVRIQGSGVIEEWDARTGDRKMVESMQKEDAVEFATDFPPAGERVYRLVPKSEAGLPVAVRLKEIERVPLNGPYPWKMAEPNVCVLDRARWRLDGGSWQPADEVLRIDKAVRGKLGIRQRGGDMVQPWFAKKYHPEPEVRAKLELGFNFEVEEFGATPIELVMESPADFLIQVNGKPLKAIPRRENWVDVCFSRFELPRQVLRRGTNEILLSCGFHEGINIEALYLLGDFGVTIRDCAPVLGKLPEFLQPGCCTAQGLPFYGAEVSYEVALPKRATGESRYFLELPSFEGACVIVGRGRGEQMIAFPPFECDVTRLVKKGAKLEIRVVLTRRNTFGPLHQLPSKAAAYHPGGFRTVGREWSDSPVLYPAGLLAPPVLSRRAPAAQYPDEVV